MTQPTRMRAQSNGTSATVRMQMAHAMESGRRKDASNRLVPAWYIRQVTVTHNGKVVLTAGFGTAVSQNPYLQFVVRGAQAGDTIGIDWTDNRGETRSDTTTVL